MKKGLQLTLILSLLIGFGIWATGMYSPVESGIKFSKLKSVNQDFQDGDIIFQSSTSRQSLAIQLATHSKYSHVGIIYKVDGDLFVLEAVQPVKITPFKIWVSHGDNNHYVVKRLKNANQILTKEVINKMKQIGNKYTGKNYDLYFEWSDDRIYCSELVWKVFQEGAGVEIGELQKLSDFDLTSEVV